MRSLLFVPGDSDKKLQKGLGSGADAVIVDLEDSVAPANKKAARETAAAFLTEARAGDAPLIYVRVNDFSTGLIDDDLAAVIAGRPDGIMLPKTTGGGDVARLSTKLRVHEAEAGL
ncbi:MAG: aldolase/citrate lyase family protein, partial [Nitratireductor sp.]